MKTLRGLYEYDLKENTYELIFRDSRVDITAVASSLDDDPVASGLIMANQNTLLSFRTKLKKSSLKILRSFLYKNL